MRTLVLLLLGTALVVMPNAPAWSKDAKRPGVPTKALQKKIDEAIAKGAAWLRTQQKVSGQLAAVKHSTTAYYEIGGTALAGLALLAAGDKKGDPVVDKAMTYCMRKDKEAGGGRTTYDTGVLLMFAIKYYGSIPPVKKLPPGKTVEGKIKRNPCKLPEDVRDWVRSMADWLVQKQRDTGDWGYPTGDADYSNTQYALLGLRAAKDCGIPIPPQTWMRAIDRTLELQMKDGPKVPRIVKDKERTYVVGHDKARGWSYKAGVNVPTGSMTTAGIAILQIAHDGLLRPRKFPPYKPSKQVIVARAVQDGFAWLTKFFTVERNPGVNAPAWHYYYLYGLERAGVLAARPMLGEHDWYIEGAKYLVGKQLGDGRWHTGALGGAEYEASDVIDTAWAILFLKRATRPVVPMPVVTGD